MRHNDNDFKDFFREIPTAFKVIWALGAVLSVTVVGVVVWAIITLVNNFA